MGWILGQKGFGLRQRRHVDRCAGRHNRRMSLSSEPVAARARRATSDETATPSSHKSGSQASYSSLTQFCNGEAVADHEEHPNIEFSDILVILLSRFRRLHAAARVGRPLCRQTLLQRRVPPYPALCGPTIRA